ncbi:MAG: HAMP domain-containing sensor histidine kinase [Bacteroidales bacterium]|jgi:two-component system sensor histidine kinase ArlS|nr:HAMP domain-containing sensor histidine kinase [Bacteroidales bacterium]
MSKKLLHKTQQVYLVFSVAIFIVVAPLFYFFSQKFYIENTDETLILYKTEFIQNSISKLKENDIAVWNSYNTRTQIQESIGLKTDSLFYTTYFNQVEQENEPYRELNSPIRIQGKLYTFSARVNLVESEDLMTSIALLFFILILLMLLGLFIITKKLSLSLWKPFYKTLRQIEDFEINKKSQPQFSATKIEEFNRLNKSIENLIQKNIVIYENQREFVENAAHELQTPIAVFKAKIDTLINRSDVTQGQSGILSSIIKSIARLDRLNKNLLFLSKIDKNQFSETHTFSIKELIENQLDFFTEQAKQKNIKIKTNLKGVCSINSNIGLTEILISNLFLNAIRHNVKNGEGEVNISLSEQKLEITNTGSLEELSQKKLFNRFSKSNSSEQGNGLGLAIIKKIADLNNWEISYSFSDNLHFFSVRF